MRIPLLALLFSAIVCPGTFAAGPSPADMLSQITASPAVSMKVIGHSVEGRPLHLVVAAEPGAIERGAPSVLVICGQHGDEPIAPRAAVRVIRRLAGGSIASVRQRIVTLVVPLANPDGWAARRRANAAGVDLNRDWRARTQPETRAIFDVFLQWRPVLVIDAHEWAPDDVHACNAVEVPLLAPGGAEPSWALPLNRWVSGTLKACGGQGVYVQRTHWGATNDPRLAHRHFASAWGTPAVLYETMPAGAAPDDARVGAASTFLSQMLATVAASEPPPAAASPPPPPKPAPPTWPTNLALASGLLLLLMLSHDCGSSVATLRRTVTRPRGRRLLGRRRYSWRTPRRCRPLRSPAAPRVRHRSSRARKPDTPRLRSTPGRSPA